MILSIMLLSFSNFFFLSPVIRKNVQRFVVREKKAATTKLWSLTSVHLMRRAVFLFSFNIYLRSKEKSRFKDSKEMMKLSIYGDVISNSVDVPHASVRGAKSKTMDFCHSTKAKIDSKILFLFFFFFFNNSDESPLECLIRTLARDESHLGNRGVPQWISGEPELRVVPLCCTSATPCGPSHHSAVTTCSIYPPWMWTPSTPRSSVALSSHR